MAGNIPADVTQYFDHTIRILQKHIYLYGWEDLISEAETSIILTLFVGVMFGVKGATTTITKLSISVAPKTSKSIASKTLTK